MKKGKKDENPMFCMPGALLWLFCCPLALVLYAHYDFKISEAKRKAKRHERAVENWDRWWG